VAPDAVRYADFAASAGDWFWELDERLRLTAIVPAPGAAAPPLGDGDLGKTFAELGLVETPSATLAALEAALGRHEPFRDLVFARAGAGGKLASFALAGRPVSGPGDAFRGYRGVGRDVTAIAERARADGEERRRVAEASEAKSAFIATVSHELRSPLNAIIGFAEVMGREVLGPLGSPKYVGYAHDISSAGQHMLSLVNDILDMAKLERGQHALEEGEIDLAKTVEDSVAVVRTRAERARQTVEVRLKATPRLRADGRALRQMLINLLTNAIKFTPEGGKIAIESSLAEGDGRVLLRVHDNGIGITPEDLQRLGKPFVQLRPGRDLSEGAGLGLAITRYLAELHGGALTIESSPGKGTSATIALPATRVIAAAAPAAAAAS
jgi:signal transduction histidine kinase